MVTWCADFRDSSNEITVCARYIEMPSNAGVNTIVIERQPETKWDIVPVIVNKFSSTVFISGFKAFVPRVGISATLSMFRTILVPNCRLFLAEYIGSNRLACLRFQIPLLGNQNENLNLLVTLLNQRTIKS